MGKVRRHSRSRHRHEDLRRVSPVEGAAEEVRLRARARHSNRQRTTDQSENSVMNITTRATAVQSPVSALRQYGQSIWLDFIRRSLISGGELARLVEGDGLAGVTSNPAIFEKAISGSNDYAAAIEEISKAPYLDAKGVYELLAIKDIQDTADVLRPLYDEVSGRDGYVSLEVSPELANDTEGTLVEARRLWQAVARPNVMIKVPATDAGLPAIRTLISEGVNVNVTLLFAVEAY